MLKNFIIDLADRLAWFCKRRAALWLQRSRWWDDFAETIQSGEALSEVRKRREKGGSHGIGLD